LRRKDFKSIGWKALVGSFDVGAVAHTCTAHLVDSPYATTDAVTYCHEILHLPSEWTKQVLDLKKSFVDQPCRRKGRLEMSNGVLYKLRPDCRSI
jgi:hypothetical protein